MVADPPPGEAPPDQPPSAVVCRAELAVTGAFTPSAPPPADGRCDPAGSWTVELAVTDPGDCGEVPIETSYVYQVTGSADAGYTVDYPAAPMNDHILLKVTSEGGTCQGIFEHYAADGKAMLLIKPFADDGALAGLAAYEEYSAPQI